MPLAMMARAGYWPGFVLGFLAMAIPMVLAIRGPALVRHTRDAVTG